jgi:hypothetical protein
VSPVRRALIATLLLGLCAGGAAAAQDSTHGFWSYRPRQFEFYAGVLAAHNRLPAAFDGEAMYVGTDRIVLVPAIWRGSGWGLAVGTKGILTRTLAGGIDFSYCQSSHHGEWMGQLLDATHGLFNIDFRLYLLPRLRVQPFALIGLCVPTVSAGQSYITYQGVSKARFGGMGANLGLGLLLYANSRVALRGGAVYRYLSFSGVSNGLDDPAQLDRSITGGVLDAEAGVTIHFGR